MLCEKPIHGSVYAQTGFFCGELGLSVQDQGLGLTQTQKRWSLLSPGYDLLSGCLWFTVFVRCNLTEAKCLSHEFSLQDTFA